MKLKSQKGRFYNIYLKNYFISISYYRQNFVVLSLQIKVKQLFEY